MGAPETPPRFANSVVLVKSLSLFEFRVLEMNSIERSFIADNVEFTSRILSKQYDTLRRECELSNLTKFSILLLQPPNALRLKIAEYINSVKRGLRIGAI